MKRTILACMCGAAGYLAPLLRAQPAPLTFEVASVKPSTSGFNGVRGGCHGIDSRANEAALTPLGRCVITDGRLSHLLVAAFDVRAIDLIKNAPDWVIAGAERFNVEAKAEDPTKATEQQLRQMLQNLLVERFKLRFHRESKDMPGFALVVSKNGHKLRDAQGDKVVTNFGGAVKPIPGTPISLTARKYSAHMLANLFSQLGSGPVIDSTGLQGEYDFELSWDDTAGPSLFTAVQEQLGLRLESRKVPVSLFVIDSAQKPTGN